MQCVLGKALANPPGGDLEKDHIHPFSLGQQGLKWRFLKHPHHFEVHEAASRTQYSHCHVKAFEGQIWVSYKQDAATAIWEPQAVSAGSRAEQLDVNTVGDEDSRSPELMKEDVACGIGDCGQSHGEVHALVEHTVSAGIVVLWAKSNRIPK
eukprot:CAMPEP_0114288632 /NCGR_PEP_ID=MMETSP0059-20121206/6921_1 /TAXON_ID=36894 /ORGANISM="Pyramimonas parkeae, Strain CCMP726" /LENGTH=151 /DNA_ID=CAMNT_0001409805 /DNA_START=551 /DNA_END=1007 /DNA_ORIENTATION=-